MTVPGFSWISARQLLRAVAENAEPLARAAEEDDPRAARLLRRLGEQAQNFTDDRVTMQPGPRT